MAVTYDAVGEMSADRRGRFASPGVKRLALAFLWITIATSGVVYWEPAPYDVLLIGATLLLPLVGLVTLNRGLIVYLFLICCIAAGGFVGVTQAGIVDIPLIHVSITLYLALTSVVIAAFVARAPTESVRLIMSAYTVAALIATIAALVGYFNVIPALYDIFTEFGRARGTFKDPNVLGAFLVPPLLYAFNAVLTARPGRAGLWATTLPLFLFAILLSTSRGAWLNLAASVFVFAAFIFLTASTHRKRVRLTLVMMLSGACVAGLLVAALSLPEVGEALRERATFQQSYDVGHEGRFGGQKKAAELVATHPLGIGALEFARLHHHEDVHQVYLNMYLSTGWIGGTLYIFLVLATAALGLKLVLVDRRGAGLSAVLVAAFAGIALEGLVVDTDHWRHAYLIMAMIWGMALRDMALRDLALRDLALRDLALRDLALREMSDGVRRCPT